jgi:hypothetical protein
MATSNFHNVNANKIFACKLEDEWDYNHFISNIKSELKNSKYYFTENGNDDSELRSYPSSVIGTIISSKQYKDFEAEIKLTVIVRSGYYEGINLDWQIGYSVGAGETDEIDFAQDLEYVADYSPEKAKQFAGYAEKWAEVETEVIVNFIEEVFENYSTPVRVVARFSNGETIYQNA